MSAWLHAPDYFLTRIVLQRGLGLIYLIAFLVALRQFPALLGSRGLMPVPNWLEHHRFKDSPSLFHWRYSDGLLKGVAIAGSLISLAILIGLPERLPTSACIAVWLVIWALYLSIVNVGQTFYSFGWETLLLEAGFLAAFLGPAHAPVPITIIWLFRWLLFRLEFGAGLIKLRGDQCWRDLTCMDYHHETQPMPNRLSWYFHHLPRPLHRVEAVGNFFAQLVAPWFLFFPQPFASVAGLVMIVTQSWLLISGNYAWLNAITLLLGFSALDSSVLGRVLPMQAPNTVATIPWFDGLTLAITALVVFLSYRPARNLISKQQLMNASFDPLHLVNTYGAFGSVTRERREVVIEGTADGSTWKEYEFPGKPTDPHFKPRQFAPIHLRLDWLLWFAALSPAYAYSWFVPLMEKLLTNDRKLLALIRENPFPDQPPRAVRAVLYKYRYTTWKERRETGAFWVRTRLREYMPPVTISEEEQPA